jgi:hypothetical protein
MKTLVALIFSAALLVTSVPAALAHCGGCGVDCATDCSKKGVSDKDSCMKKCKTDHPKDKSSLSKKNVKK